MIIVKEFKKNNHIFSYFEKNNDSKKNIIFLHGLNNNKHFYYNLIDSIDDYNCYALDYRAHGKSTSDGAYTLDSFSDDILSFINYLNVEDNYYIVASSLSCWLVSNLEGKINPKGVIFLDGGYYSPKDISDNATVAIKFPVFGSLKDLNEEIVKEVESLREEDIFLTNKELQHVYNALMSTYTVSDNEKRSYSNILPESAFNSLINDLNTKEIGILKNDKLILLLSNSKNNNIEGNHILQKELDLNSHLFYKIETIHHSDHLLMLTSVNEIKETIQRYFN
ncbi:alpha/beta fold hydrolase [Carnobacterium sp.]|uniref:alpha/beta hydrolase n=1 Tax=Carnobacterium sp. TaxID=48221 RepID=UPI0028AAF3F1|nr:alpha/beta fold hydrolase [Carnobacterium sp.]